MVIKRSLLILLGIAAVVCLVVLLRLGDDAGVLVEMDWTGDDSCPDAVVIGAAGSGQRDDLLGVGAQVASVVSGFSTRLMERASSSVSVGVLVLDYPAPGVIEGGLFGFLGNSMFDSIAEGRENLIELVATSGSRCPRAPIYVVGYSQGASVVHTAIDEMPREHRDSIHGVVVISDPNRDADDPNTEHFTTEMEIGPEALATPHSLDGVFGGIGSPGWLNGSFYSACARQDAVCNFSLVDVFLADIVHTDETYHGLGPQLGRLLADDLLGKRGGA